MMRFLLCLAMAIVPVVAQAQNARGDIDHIRDGAPVVPDKDGAYLLIRTEVPQKALRYNIVLVRELSPPEIEQYRAAYDEAYAKGKAKSGASEAKLAEQMMSFVERYKAATNVVVMFNDRSYAKRSDGATYLLRVRPGRYMIAGPGYATVINTCMCMGTVAFEAKAGVITDLGYVLAARVDEKSTVPELRDVTGYKSDHATLPLDFAMTVRPYRDDMPTPDGLRGLAPVPADYRAVGKLPNFFGNLIARMAPVAGVLAYDADVVIDAKTGRPAAVVAQP